jgi:peptide deformylase
MGGVPKRELTNENGKVGSKITVKQDLISNVISVPDACMSFARRSGKNVEIFYRIKVKYQTRGIFGLMKTHKEWVKGLKSHIFQHEIGHAHGKNIYFK